VSRRQRRSADQSARTRDSEAAEGATTSSSGVDAAALALLVADGMDRDRAVALLEAAGKSGLDIGVVVRTALKLRETGW
jgi:hypothetical protein